MFKIALILSFLLLFTPVTSSDVYKYTDENGVVCYTDAPLGGKTERVGKTKEKQSARKSIAANHKYSNYVRKAASKYMIDPELIQAVIKTESNGDHRAISKKGAMGLMQLMPATADDMNVGNPFNPEENIDGGTKYLRYLLEKFHGNLTLALAAYNAGPKTVQRYGSVPPISETKQYVNKIFSLYQGKRNYSFLDPINQKKPAWIYKIVLEDGTILFTDSSFTGSGKIKF